ncbi:glycosyltransferase family 4 protein [Demequina muriae]|uniref:D-inositol 3-phosphate glycosyltransferase n=1 Tax=Demequina muriae TaxID=3051664 RepID=A0ABT8GH30_9MICO|nr:glycosyltransferase family 4 protein [Demequina sp. EGI L300058]MDN4480747.1 glycosyltransferase family 4 protein [Demequina sp. EGI L300058]
MKIAMVLDDSIDRPDGVQQYVLTLGAYFERQGHEVHYVCSDATRDDITVHSLARNVGVTFNGNGLRIPLPTSRAALREFLEAQRYDVIHVQIPHSPLFAARVVDEARRVQARTVRIVGTFHILPAGTVSAAATRLLGLLLRRNLLRFDAFCAVSAPAAEFARRSFGIEARVIPCSIDTSLFADAQRTPRADDRLVVAFLGRLVDRKGVLELIAALAALPEPMRARLDVHIGGKGPLRDRVAAAIEAAGLGDIVTLVGFVSEEDKPAFYAEADIAVFPATGGESFGIVLIEAMASGAGVVIGGDNPGYLSVLGDRSEVSVNPRDTAAFAASLARLIDDAALRATVHEEQAERVERFDVTVVGEQILSLYGRASA